MGRRDRLIVPGDCEVEVKYVEVAWDPEGHEDELRSFRDVTDQNSEILQPFEMALQVTVTGLPA